MAAACLRRRIGRHTAVQHRASRASTSATESARVHEVAEVSQSVCVSVGTACKSEERASRQSEFPGKLPYAIVRCMRLFVL